MAGVIVHEWLEKSGGSEKVVDAMARQFPDADIVCLWNNTYGRFSSTRVFETWLAKSVFRGRKALALPLMPETWKRLENRGYDWALTSSHLFAHHATFKREPPGFRKFSYVHTPARYLWNPELDARGAGAAVRLAAPMFKAIDRRAAQTTYEFAANSEFVKSRIERAWGRQARVIHPPVEVARIQAVADWRTALTGTELASYESLPTHFLLGASRFVAYKRLDLVIRAGEAMGMPVVLTGAGPDEEVLRKQAARASIDVHFVIKPSDEMLFTLYQRAEVFIFPAIEDFGIMPVEAMACGAPVVVNSRGGASESVVDGETGAIFYGEDTASLRDAVSRAMAVGRHAPRTRAQDFDASVFDRNLSSWIQGA